MEICETVKKLYENSCENVILTDEDFNLMWSNLDIPLTRISADSFTVGGGEIESLPLEEPSAAVYTNMFGEQSPVRISPVKEDGVVKAYLIMVYDAEEIYEMWENSKVKDKFVNVSANIRMELSGMNSAVEKAKNNKKIKDSDFKELYGKLRKHMVGILAAEVNLNELSQYYRNNAVNRALNLKKEISRLLDDFKDIAKENGCKVTFNSDEVLVSADRDRLRAALSNLLANGVMYNSKPKKRLEVLVDNDGGNAVITVTDNGDGMDECRIAALRKPFYSVKFGDRGEGLGLAIANKFSESCRGKLEIMSKKNIGTSVILTIPKLDKSKIKDLHQSIEPFFDSEFGREACIFSKINRNAHAAW